MNPAIIERKSFMRVLDMLDATFAGEHAEGRKSWMVGGCAALAIQLKHRAAHDIEFLIEANHMPLLSPEKNPYVTDLTGEAFQKEGTLQIVDGPFHFLFRPIRFLSEPAPWQASLAGRSIQIETVEAAILRKLNRHNLFFTSRDAFDLLEACRQHPKLKEKIAAQAPAAILELIEQARQGEVTAEGLTTMGLRLNHHEGWSTGQEGLSKYHLLLGEISNMGALPSKPHQAAGRGMEGFF